MVEKTRGDAPARAHETIERRDARQFSPSTQRNRDPILDVLRRVLPTQGVVLEIASGTGEHAAHIARTLPRLIWQPSDRDPEARISIAAWCGGLANVRPPLDIDVTAESWPADRADAMVCINMIHISPWEATFGMLAGAGRLLPVGGILYLYGPYKRDGRHTAASNADFDASLRSRNPAWGVRDVVDVEAAALRQGLVLDEIVAMPANNLSLIFKRQA
jgi:hypothetical protein